VIHSRAVRSADAFARPLVSHCDPSGFSPDWFTREPVYIRATRVGINELGSSSNNTGGSVSLAEHAASVMFWAATPVLRVETDGRFHVIDEHAWLQQAPCLYFVGGADGMIRFAGTSRQSMHDEWLHNNRCRPHIEREHAAGYQFSYEVRRVTGPALAGVLEQLGPPVSGFALLRGDDEGIAATVERWLANNRTARLLAWNCNPRGQRS